MHHFIEAVRWRGNDLSNLFSLHAPSRWWTHKAARQLGEFAQSWPLSHATTPLEYKWGMWAEEIISYATFHLLARVSSEMGASYLQIDGQAVTRIANIKLHSVWMRIVGQTTKGETQWEALIGLAGWLAGWWWWNIHFWLGRRPCHRVLCRGSRGKAEKGCRRRRHGIDFYLIYLWDMQQ